MPDPTLDRVIEEKKRKYIPQRSTQRFHGGVICLVSFIAGLAFFQFEAIPPDVKAEDASLVRQGLGIMLGAVLAAAGATAYLFWTLWRGYKAKQEAIAEIVSHSIKNGENSDEH